MNTVVIEIESSSTSSVVCECGGVMTSNILTLICERDFLYTKTYLHTLGLDF